MKQWKKCAALVLVAALALSGAALSGTRTAKAEMLEDENGLYERMTGNGWWENPPSSVDYAVEPGKPVTFNVKAETDAELCVELQQRDKGHYLTTATNKNAWYYNAHGGEISTNDGTNGATLVSGHEYTVTVERTDQGNGTSDYSICYWDDTLNQLYVSFDARGTNLAGSVSAYVLAQVGTFELRSEATPRLAHGTDRTKLVKPSELQNTPPKDYSIPEGLVQDAKDKLYEKYFLKDALQTVSIEIPEDNLNYILQNALQKPSAMTTSVTIGDTTVGYAGLKTKGNYTLAHTFSDSASDRFSFTINFGKYIKKKNYGAKQNFYGCNKISFNNCFFDKTIMKEYNALRLMDEMGVPTPQYGIAKLYINGEYYGVYFMVEAMDGAIIERYLNVTSKNVSDYLVKPSYTNMTYESGLLDNYMDSSGEFTMESLLGNGALNLDAATDEYSAEWPFSAYSGIWENDDDTLQDVAGMLPTVLNWNRKLQLLSEGKDFNGNNIDVNSDRYLELLDSIMDTDETVKYFATHSFIIQMDNMFTWKQNYGLYVDSEGKSMMVPWDYDLAWGCNFHPDTSEDVANWDIEMLYPDNFDGNGINTAYMSAEQVYSRAPIFHVIYQNKSLMKKFRTYVNDCTKIVSLGGTATDGKYYGPGRFAKTIDTFYPQITAAAGESMPDHVYYLNGIRQPSGTVEGIPALKKVIAMRAVGAWLQTNGREANVTGYGCDLRKLGNVFQETSPSTSGTLTAVDADTGIFATATYGSGAGGPLLTVQKLSGEDAVYKKIKGNNRDGLTVYHMQNEKKPSSEYRLYIPVSSDGSNVSLYSYSDGDGKLTKLKTEMIDHIYCVTVSDLSYIAVLVGDSTLDASDQGGTGDQGSTGGQGGSGNQGTTGNQGGTGNQGNNGNQGGTGDQGDTGNQNGSANQGTNNAGVGGTSGGDGTGKAQNTDGKPSKVSSLKAKNRKKKTVALTWKKVARAKKYQIQYSQNKKFRKAKTKTSKKPGYKVTKLKKKTYYFRVRAVSSTGKKGAWSRTVKVKVKV